MKELRAEYRRKRPDIKKRLEDFRRVYDGSDEDVFAELCFCLLTPQSKAVNCDKAVNELRCSGLLMSGGKRQISSRLRGLVRFHNNKAGYIVSARALFRSGSGMRVKEWLSSGDLHETRDRLVKDIKGLGYKEASHFLRNIGFGGDMAILDVHIMKNLKRCGVLRDIPSSLSEKRYKEIERMLKAFSRDIRIPMDELDLLFWSRQTGYIFK